MLHRAIENGANALAEGFLFGVAALLIVGETWRSSRSQSKRRDTVDDQLEDLQTKLSQLAERVDAVQQTFDERWSEEKQRLVLVQPFEVVPSTHHAILTCAETTS